MCYGLRYKAYEGSPRAYSSRRHLGHSLRGSPLAYSRGIVSEGHLEHILRGGSSGMLFEGGILGIFFVRVPRAYYGFERLFLKLVELVMGFIWS